MSVYIKLSGGLGNQLFQYAIGRSLSIQKECNLYIDTCWYSSIPDGSTDRSILINQLDTKAIYINSKGKTEELINQYNGKLINKFLKRKITKENKYFSYDSTLIKKLPPIYLDGYWQSFKYFHNIRDILINDFKPIETTNNYQEFEKLISDQKESVMIHIRRGDYVNSPSASKIHGFIGTNYYRNAIEQIKNLVPNPVFFVFSDDISWCKEHLPKDSIIFIETKNSAASPISELSLMSHCKHHIIANSTFSWWGAWLCEYKNKNVIAPKHWLSNQIINLDDLIPQDWVLM